MAVSRYLSSRSANKCHHFFCEALLTWAQDQLQDGRGGPVHGNDSDFRLQGNLNFTGREIANGID